LILPATWLSRPWKRSRSPVRRSWRSSDRNLAGASAVLFGRFTERTNAMSRYREEFVIVGWSDPTGSLPHLGALLLGYDSNDGEVIYAGRVGMGMPTKVLADLRRRLAPLARKTSPLSVQPNTLSEPPSSPSRVHWVEPKLFAEIRYSTWPTGRRLLYAVYVGLREDTVAEL
jgi:ATP-dependent DNA ligase